MNALQLLRQRYGDGEARALYELIMQRRFGLSRTDLLLGKDTTLSANDKAELQIIVDRVAKGEPVHYVLGCEEFCGHTFLVGPGVLIPRPETQQLVGLVRQNVPLGSRVLDVGTGSGCIAITLALDGYRVSAIDVSDDALQIARRNAERQLPPLKSVTRMVAAPSPLPLWGSASFSQPLYSGFVALPQRGSGEGALSYRQQSSLCLSERSRRDGGQCTAV